VADAMRRAKHRAWVLKKHAGWGFPQYRGPITDPFWRAMQTFVPYAFPQEKYARTWLGHDEPLRSIPWGEPLPRRIFVVWTGDNPMSTNRLRGLDSLRAANSDVEVVVVDPHTLSDWLVPGQPLPQGYENLSLVHRSDVLRCYLLHHHGGGYADVKPFDSSWSQSFLELERSDHWALGYTEVHRFNTPLVGGTLQSDLHRVSRQLFGYGALIMRAHTPLTKEWLDRVDALLASRAGELAAHPGNVRGDNPGYPFGWTELLAHVVAPLTWKYQAHVLHDNRIRPRLRNYQ